MSDNFEAATRKWPNVPACYGWLTLTRRGDWRLGDGRTEQAGRVSHGGLLDFINRNYAPAGDDAWCVHNGPQKVYAALEYTPWIWRLTAGGLRAHTGAEAGVPDAAWLDEDGSLLLHSGLGIGLLDDRDLPELLHHLTDGQGQPLSDEALEALCAGIRPASGAFLRWGEALLALEFIRKADVPSRFGFDPAPQQ